MHDERPVSLTTANAPELDDDDRPVGRILTRREVLLLFGAGAGAVAVAACVPGSGATAIPGASASAPASAAPGASPIAGTTPSGTIAVPTCVVVPEQAEGPYFVDVGLDRSDIRADTATGAVSAGAPFALAVAVSRIDGTGCVPLEGALVDVWHCDVDGRYSGVADTSGQTFLRGSQRTDASGVARFATIYPGWYRGRTVHVHFKVRTDPDAASGTIFTSQLYFDDAVTDEVFAAEPYAARGPRSTRNPDDGIYRQGGDQLLVPVTTDGAGGYAGTFAIGIQLD